MKKTTKYIITALAAALCLALTLTMVFAIPQLTKTAGSAVPGETVQLARTIRLGKSIITTDEAKTIALNHANVNSADATFTKARLVRDNGTREYEIEFTANGYEYDYDINAYSGAIAEWDVEPIEAPVVPGISPANPTFIAEVEAKAIAVKHAGVNSADVVYTKVQLDQDDGVWEYEVDFTANGYEYDYEINAVSGAVISWDVEPIEVPKTPAPTAPTAPTAPANPTFITEAEAKDIAVKHAGVNAADVTFTQVKLEKDDGRWEYEVDFNANGYEYDYEIDAENGRVLSFDTEAIEAPKTPRPTTASSTQISKDEAKAIALKHAGLKASQVRFTKAKLDRDDGRYVYEIEFTYRGYEYEYEINAETGKIIEWDKERD